MGVMSYTCPEVWNIYQMFHNLALQRKVPMKTYSIILAISLWLAASVCAAGSTWPTLHKDYKRSGWTEEVVAGPYERKWYRDFHDEMIATRVEAIVAGGKCFVGTFAGNFYALDVATGETVWTFKAEGPLGTSPCYEAGRLYVGADVAFNKGHLYCIDANDGSEVWRYTAGAGIWASPACNGKTVYVGDRAGVFHAVSAKSGQLEWSFCTSGMILKPASLAGNNRKPVVGSEDMHVYCFGPKGELLWKSKKLQGLSMRDQGATIWNGLAIVRTNPADSFHTVLDRNGHLLKQIQQSLPTEDVDKVLMDKWGDLVMHPTARRRKAEQDGVVKYLKENPYDKCFYAFNIADGNEPWTAPVFYTCGLHNPPTPPTFNPKTDELYTFGRSAMTYYLRGVRRYNVLGRINRQTGRFDLYWPESDNEQNWYPMAMIGDETQALSMMGNILISNHQGTLGGLDLDTKEVINIWAGRDTYGGIFGPAAVEGGFEGAKRLAKQGYLTGMPNEWHGPDRSICAVAEGRLFWVAGSQVVCIAGPDVPKADTGGTKSPDAQKSKLPWCVSGGNVASEGGGSLDEKVEKKNLLRADVTKYVEQLLPSSITHADSDIAKELRSRLDAQVLELVNDGQWAPFIVELGISGEERHFWRAAQTMQIVSLSLPHVSPAVRSAAIAFLDRMFESGMPLKQSVHSNEGNRREPYELGPGMKSFAAAEIRYEANIEDIYALWAYAHFADRWDEVLGELDRVTGVFDDFAGKPFEFKHDGTNDESEQLNRQIAGVLAGARIFAKADDKDAFDKAVELLGQMSTERVHHERADNWLIRPSKQASKGLHQAKVPRYVGLVPEVGTMLNEHASEELTKNVRALMQGLPLWYQAYSERMIGGENYISPPHLSRGIFLAMADGAGAEPKELTAKLDQPWCKADMYYIEKISAILRKLDIKRK